MDFINHVIAFFLFALFLIMLAVKFSMKRLHEQNPEAHAQVKKQAAKAGLALLIHILSKK